MGYVAVEENRNTLQTSFSYFNPEYLVTGEDYLNFGYDTWVILEYEIGADAYLRPGEEVFLLQYNSFLGTFDTNSIESVTYEGLVDLDEDGWLDSVVVSLFSQEQILTDLRPFVDFSPYSTEVTVNKIGLGINRGAVFLSSDPPEQPFNGIYGTSRKNTLVGTKGDDAIFGYGGKDYITGKAGDDIIDGGPGNDRLKGSSGNDSIWGGRGLDRIEGGSGADDFWFDTKNRYDKILDFRRADTIVIDTVDGSFRGVSEDDVEVRDGSRYDRIFVEGDLVAKVFGSDVGPDDIFLL